MRVEGKARGDVEKRKDMRGEDKKEDKRRAEKRMEYNGI